MRKAIIAALMAQIIVIISMACYGQWLPSRCRYVSTVYSRDTIQIQNDTLIKIENTMLYPHDTVAICKLKHERGNYYELRSVNMNKYSGLNNMKVEQFSTGIDSDVIFVVFELPQWGYKDFKYNLTIEIPNVSTSNPVTVSYNSKNGAVGVIPNPHYDIGLRNLGFEFKFDITSNGNIFPLESPKIRIKPNTDIIRIILPDFKPWKVFGLEFIYSEFIYITDKEIKWRGYTYKRQKDWP